ncbi:choline transporter protein 2-like [Tropilaelaps mercedesae]|uniref:Choline transporter protein 2-like n=1 Tax=Tropilaelaps mercedesae TaxID=418985 RepID=A0A1V9X9N1_9ACAR|nr:choline transporter protein 2-like [Tropilaelaps mercedesae]
MRVVPFAYFCPVQLKRRFEGNRDYKGLPKVKLRELPFRHPHPKRGQATIEMKNRRYELEGERKWWQIWRMGETANGGGGNGALAAVELPERTSAPPAEPQPVEEELLVADTWEELDACYKMDPGYEYPDGCDLSGGSHPQEISLGDMFEPGQVDKKIYPNEAHFECRDLIVSNTMGQCCRPDENRF